MWSVFFLIPVGRGLTQERITPPEYELAFEKLWHHARRQPYGVKTTEAPHYRRYVLQQQRQPAGRARRPGDRNDAHRGHRAPLGVWDGRGVMFVSHTGEIFPAGFLPLLCGRFPEQSVVDAYQNHPTFRALRDPGPVQGQVRHLRVPPHLRRQPRPGLRRHRRSARIGAGLRLRAGGGCQELTCHNGCRDNFPI